MDNKDEPESSAEAGMKARIKQVEAIRSAFWMYPELRAIRRDFERMHERDGTLTESMCMFLHGPTRSGKTHLITSYVKEHPPTRGPDGDRQEVLYVRAPNPCTPKNLVEKMAKLLGYPSATPPATRGPRMFDMVDVVLHYAQGLGVRLVFIDEIHHLTDDRAGAPLRSGAKLIKDFVSEGKFRVVTAGTASAWRIFEADVELKGRNPLVRELKPFDWHERADRDAFRGLLETMDGELPFLRSGLADADMAARIHAATGGVIGHVAILVEMAGVIAVYEGADRIRLGHFARAFEDAQFVKGRPTPFGDPDPDALPQDRPPPPPPLPRGARRRRADDDFRA